MELICLFLLKLCNFEMLNYLKATVIGFGFGTTKLRAFRSRARSAVKRAIYYKICILWGFVNVLVVSVLHLRV